MNRLEKPNWQKKQEKKKTLWLVLLCAFLLIPLGIGLAFIFKNAVSEAGITVNGTTITIKEGGDLQAALNRAKSGDTIILQAGAKFVGAFTLPDKQGNEFITIQSSELARLPKDGMRVSPKDAALMPKILSSGKGESAVKTAPNAHHYRFVGIEFAPANADYIYNLIALGADDQKADEIPHDIEIDRCYLHPNPSGITRRGIALNNADTIIKNSYIAGFAGKGEETQAIAGWNGTGGYKIINNYLEAGAENILFGGSDPSIKNLVPTDIEIRNNLMTKPLEWRGKVTIKCTFELKNARNVRIIGNIIENSFDEMAIRLTVRNQDGSAPWSVIEDVLMQNNWIRNSGGGINFLGMDDTHESAKMKRVQIINNLFTGLDAEKWGSGGRFLLIADGEDITIANNTIFNSGGPITAHRAPSRRFTFRNNIISYGSYGFRGDDAPNEGVLAKYFADGTFAGNIIVNGSKAEKQYIYVPPRNTLVNNFSEVGFVNLQSGNFRLAPNSRYQGKGADIDAIEAEIKKAQ
ncbi:MAG: hypothetical protein ACR2MG_20525 [Pyrinomonadaceae bacterium]